MNKTITTRILFILLILFLIGIGTGCHNPSEPYVMPPCKWIKMYDKDGNYFSEYVAPGQTIGVVMTCDIHKPHTY
jgi:hypothetical protein